MLNKSLAVGIILLFIFSTVTPMVIGYDVEIANREFMDDLAFDCYDRYNSSKVSYYREHLFKNYSNDGDVELEEHVIPVKIPTMVRSRGPMDSPWPMKCHDNRHTGRSPYNTADNNGVELWRFKCSWIEGGPVIDDEGVIYFCDYIHLYALYPDGTLKWEYKLNGRIWSTPAIAKDETIYIGTYGDSLYAINPNGTLKWEYPCGGSIISSPAIGVDGTIYTGTMGNKIYAINPDGTEKWHYQTDYKITGDPAVADDGTIYIGSGDTYLYAMNPDGTLEWRFKTGHYIKGPPSIADDGTIYIGSWDDYLYALNHDGAMKWKCKVGAGTETNPSIGPDGTIYVGGSYLWAINPDGTMKWTFDLGENQYIHQSSPAVSEDGVIYVGTNIGETSGGDIIAVNPDGTERWRKTIANKWVESSPCIGGNGIVYIGSSSDDDSGYSCGYLYAFGPGEVPPNPPTITGPSSGKTGEEYSYSISTTDPDDDNIFYYVEWDDGTNTGWQGPYPSGTRITLNHTWTIQGTFTIKAKAKDENDSESDWATLEVSMPKNKPYTDTPFLNFLESHLHMFPLLRQIFGLQ